MGRVAKSERTKAQLRAEARGIRRAKKVAARPAPKSKPTPGRYVVAPGYKAVRRRGKIVPKPKSYTRRYMPKSPVFTRRPIVRGPEQYRKLSYQPRLTLTKDGKLSRSSYRKGTVQYQQAQRFARSPMGKLYRSLQKEEKRQSALLGKPVKLNLDRRTGKVTRVAGAKAVAADNQRQFKEYQAKRTRVRDQREGRSKFEKTVLGAGKETGNLTASLFTGLLPNSQISKGLAKGEIGRRTASSGAKLKTSGISLPQRVDQRVKAKKPENLLRIVDQTQRPVLGVTGGLKQVVENARGGKSLTKNVGREAKKGLALKERDYGSDVLKAAGIGGAGALIGGFALDVLLDPTTYVTFGAGSAGKIGAVQAAKAAGRQMERKAFKSLVRGGMKKSAAREQARKRGAAKAKQVYEQAVKDDRFAVQVGGKRRKATIKTPFRVKQKPTGVGGKGKSAASGTVKPTTTPGGADHIQFQAALNSNRKVRAVTSAFLGAAQISADWLAKKIKPEHYDSLISALERGSSRGLPDYLTRKTVKVRINKESTPKYRETFKAARKEGKSVEEATAAAQKATQGDKYKYRKISIFEAMRSDFRQAQRIRKNAGQAQGTIRDYFPHMVDDTIRGRRSVREVVTGVEKRPLPEVDQATAQADSLRASLQRTKAGRAGSTMRRNIRLSLADANQQLREQGKRLFSVDVPLVTSNYKLQTGKIVSQGVFNEEVGKLGRRVKIRSEVKPKVRMEGDEMVDAGTSVTRKVDIGPVAANERVYVKSFETRTLDTGEQVPGRVEWRRATDSEMKALSGGTVPRNIRDVIVADKQAFRKVEEAFDQFTTVPRKLEHLKGLDDPTTGEKAKKALYWTLDTIVDRPMRVWKGIATRTPQFHLRNMIGDVSMAYNVVPASRMPQLSAEALKVTWYLRGSRKNMLGFSERDATIRIGYRDKKNLLRRYETMDVADFADELIENGVVLGGVLGSDLDSYSKYGARGISKMNGSAARTGRGIDRTLQDRENLMRIVVYKHFRDEGLDPAAAARKTADALIDYGELSKAEREVFKRAAPFYTFAARSIPIYALTLVKRPGKIANIEKLRQEISRATGTDAENLKDEQTYRQRGYAFPVKINGVQYMPSFGLPLMALNQLPAGLSLSDLQKTINENIRFFGSSLAPIIGIPLETRLNESLFYGRDLENDAPRGRKVPTVLPSLFDTIAAQLGGTTTASGKDNRYRTVLGIGPVLDRRSGKNVTGIRGKADNAIAKALPGAPGLVLNLSRDNNRRGQTEKQMLASFFSGVKLDKADPEGGAIETLFRELTRIDQEIADIPGKTGRDARDKRSLAKQANQIKAAIYKLDKKRGNTVPLFNPPGRKKDTGGKW